MTRKNKKSVASSLTSLLRISRWVLWYVLITLPLAAMNAPFLPFTIGANPEDADAVWPTMYLSPLIEQEGTLAALYLETAISMAFAGLGLFVIHHLLKILENVKSGEAFARDNGERLRKIGFGVAYVQIGVYIALFTSFLADSLAGIDFEGLVVQLSPAPWIGVFGALALSTIFLEGAEIKEEQDLTV